MKKRKITCIECPKGCQLEVDIEGKVVVKVTGNQCVKGEVYAKQEMENPQRILSSTVLTEGLELKMAPVRTNNPIPKVKLSEAMSEIKRLKLTNPVKTGDIIVTNFLNLGIDLIATREVNN